MKKPRRLLARALYNSIMLIQVPLAYLFVAAILLLFMAPAFAGNWQPGVTGYATANEADYTKGYSGREPEEVIAAYLDSWWNDTAPRITRNVRGKKATRIKAEKVYVKDVKPAAPAVDVMLTDKPKPKPSDAGPSTAMPDKAVEILKEAPAIPEAASAPEVAPAAIDATTPPVTIDAIDTAPDKAGEEPNWIWQAAEWIASKVVTHESGEIAVPAPATTPAEPAPVQQ